MDPDQMIRDRLEGKSLFNTRTTPELGHLDRRGFALRMPLRVGAEPVRP